MLMVGLLGMLAGAVLGMRFRVFILFPAMALACAVIAALGLFGNDGVWTAALAMTVAAAALQMGYFAGMITRTILAAARATAPRTASRLPAAQ